MLGKPGKYISTENGAIAQRAPKTIRILFFFLQSILGMSFDLSISKKWTKQFYSEAFIVGYAKEEICQQPSPLVLGA